jgi:3-polyprenyl-4-hydroxybenzoate decarboxylase
MALSNAVIEHPTTVGYVSRQATVAVDERVKDILVRREIALRQARLAAQRLKQA